jgi:hypothetical protein
VTGPAAGAAGAAGVAALQRALAAENAAIYGYGVAGAYLTGTRRATATAFWNDHRSAADKLAAMLRAHGAQPAAADAAYKLPFPVRDARRAAALATFLEDGLTAVYLGVAGGADAALRKFGGLAMQDCAVRAAIWRGSSEAFPGFPGGTLKSRLPRGLFFKTRCGLSRWPVARERVSFVTIPRGGLGGLLGQPFCCTCAPCNRAVPSPGRAAEAQSRGASTLAIRAAAKSRSSLTPIRSAQDHQNHQLPSWPRPA